MSRPSAKYAPNTVGANRSLVTRSASRSHAKADRAAREEGIRSPQCGGRPRGLRLAGEELVRRPCARPGGRPTRSDVGMDPQGVLGHPDAPLPGPGGEVFPLTESAHGGAFELTDFLITDRLRNPDAPDPSARVASAASRPQSAVTGAG